MSLPLSAPTVGCRISEAFSIFTPHLLSKCKTITANCRILLWWNLTDRGSIKALWVDLIVQIPKKLTKHLLGFVSCAAASAYYQLRALTCILLTKTPLSHLPLTQQPEFISLESATADFWQPIFIAKYGNEHDESRRSLPAVCRKYHPQVNFSNLHPDKESELVKIKSCAFTAQSISIPPLSTHPT